MGKYLTLPPRTTGVPKGIPYIIANEAAERYSYYGMRSILVVFMTQHLLNRQGELDPMSEHQAGVWYHTFLFLNYATPLLGALLADIFWGKYRTIMALSLVYCAGHLALAVDETRWGLGLGLVLIGIGSGGIKPCVSAHVGDQFAATNRHLMTRVFAWFYFSVNVGAMISAFLAEPLLDRYGSGVAFGVPGLLMGLATLVFWMGRHKFVHVPPRRDFLQEVKRPENWRPLLKLSGLFVFLIIYWSVYDQTGSSWITQAGRMDRHLDWGRWAWTVSPSQLQALNPILVLLFIPLFSEVLFPWISRHYPLSAVRKIGIGFALMILPFLICARVEHRIALGEQPPIEWQVLAYVLLTASEVFVYMTALEFSYSQAPRVMKSFVMGVFFITVALGNLLTAGINFAIDQGWFGPLLEGHRYFLFFGGLMALTLGCFIPVARRYRETTHLQDETAPPPA